MALAQKHNVHTGLSPSEGRCDMEAHPYAEGTQEGPDAEGINYCLMRPLFLPVSMNEKNTWARLMETLAFSISLLTPSLIHGKSGYGKEARRETESSGLFQRKSPGHS